eukprot:146010_1
MVPTNLAFLINYLMTLTVLNSKLTTMPQAHNIESIVDEWTPLHITFQSLIKSNTNMESNLKHRIETLTESLMIHPLRHSQYHLPIPSYCQNMLHPTLHPYEVSFAESDILLYIIRNTTDTQCNPYHLQPCISDPHTHRLLFGIINLCDIRNTSHAMDIAHTIYRMLDITHTPRHSRRLLSATELLPTDKEEILSEINKLRSRGALNGIQLGANAGLRPMMRSTRMEAYIWDDALMYSAIRKAQTCDLSMATSNRTLSALYINNSHRIPIVDPTATFVGEIVYNATQSSNYHDAMDEALDQWESDCSYLEYQSKGCDLTRAPSLQNCDNCRRLLDETARYIGCGFSNCSSSIVVVCHIYFSTNIRNLVWPNAWVPYWGAALGNKDPCENCPWDRSNCTESEGLCRGCPSLNYEACVYANDNDPSSVFCPPLTNNTSCSPTGITTLTPTASPTNAPTFAPTNTVGALDIMDLLNNVINMKRRRVAQGLVIYHPRTGDGIRAFNMEKLIWDQSLGITATNVSLECNVTYTNATKLAILYRDTLDAMGVNARVVVSDNPHHILVGETMHVVADWLDANDAALQAFNAWELECDRFDFGISCDNTSDPTLCRNCLQLIWSKTRYIGCGLSGCPVIENVNGSTSYNSILFVCHWYWGADLFNYVAPPSTQWLQPYEPRYQDVFCREDPFEIAGCNDTERNRCDDGLCDGCAHDNYHQCTTKIAFNQQVFGNEGCAFVPIPPTCSDGATPTASPSFAPTLTEPNLSNVLKRANDHRIEVARGRTGPTVSNMQSFIWHEPLAQSAFCTANTCNITPTDPDDLARRFQQSTTLIVSEDPSNIIIGETRFISDDWNNPEDSLIQAINYWFEECARQNYVFNVGCCNGQCSLSNCSACLQMIWATTRYIGCSYESCSTIIDEDGATQDDALYVVCHYYFGANITENNDPYIPGSVCALCPEDRRNCTASVCTGCAADNWELCTLSEPNTCNVSQPVSNCTLSGIPSPQHPPYTECPTLSPTTEPTASPTYVPTVSSLSPSTSPTGSTSAPTTPSSSPTLVTSSPTAITLSPTISSSAPTAVPSIAPTERSTSTPSTSPSTNPTRVPTTLSPSIAPSLTPTGNPIRSPSFPPSDVPTSNPTGEPSITPSNAPSEVPSSARIPSVTPSVSPSIVPTRNPSGAPSDIPTNDPTETPSLEPTWVPTHIPSLSPSLAPIRIPTHTPSDVPTQNPTTTPSFIPSDTPSISPSQDPTASPSDVPSSDPSTTPSIMPTRNPLDSPSISPSITPSDVPTTNPSVSPSITPTRNPSDTPSTSPLRNPTASPSDVPSSDPSATPSISPTAILSNTPSIAPSITPSLTTTHSPSVTPSDVPTSNPSIEPTIDPSNTPSTSPSRNPTASPSDTPSANPSISPSNVVTHNPSTAPSITPTSILSNTPSIAPSITPSNDPTSIPSTFSPSDDPSVAPIHSPSSSPSDDPSTNPSVSPSVVTTHNPSRTPTADPSTTPSQLPSVPPTMHPSQSPSLHPSISPSDLPTLSPTNHQITLNTSMPTIHPSRTPTDVPTPIDTSTPTIDPSIAPTPSPTQYPTDAPTPSPTHYPTDAPTPSPTQYPTDAPSPSPITHPPTTPNPTSNPTPMPTRVSTKPTDSPTGAPTTSPAVFPTTAPDTTPTTAPDTTPTTAPFLTPTDSPNTRPTRRLWWSKNPRSYSSKKHRHVLVAVDVCFSSQPNDSYPNYGTFILPYTGTLDGITLIYSSGAIYLNGKNLQTNWGINKTLNTFQVLITDNNHDDDNTVNVLYPNRNTDGYDPTCDHKNTNRNHYCLRKQHITNHKLHLMDVNHQQLLDVSAGDIFRIYFSEMDAVDARLCVDVMVYYHDVLNKRSKSSDSLWHKNTAKPRSSDSSSSSSDSSSSSSSDSSSYKSHSHKPRRFSHSSNREFHWYWMQRWKK